VDLLGPNPLPPRKKPIFGPLFVTKWTTCPSKTLVLIGPRDESVSKNHC